MQWAVMEKHTCNYPKARELFRQGEVAGSTPHLPLLYALSCLRCNSLAT